MAKKRFTQFRKARPLYPILLLQNGLACETTLYGLLSKESNRVITEYRLSNYPNSKVDFVTLFYADFATMFYKLQAWNETLRCEFQNFK